MSATADPEPNLAAERFVSLTTFRKSGEPVPTPVWIGADGPDFVITTPAASGKVKRLRHNPLVELQPCDRFGRVGDGTATVHGTAEILTDRGDRTRVHRLLRGKYRLEYPMFMMLERLAKPTGADRVILRITPTTRQAATTSTHDRAPDAKPRPTSHSPRRFHLGPAPARIRHQETP